MRFGTFENWTVTLRVAELDELEAVGLVILEAVRLDIYQKNSEHSKFVISKGALETMTS